MSERGATAGGESAAVTEPRISGVVRPGTASGGPGRQADDRQPAVVGTARGSGSASHDRGDGSAGISPAQAAGSASGQTSHLHPTSSGPTRSTEARVWTREGGKCWLCERTTEGALTVAHQMASAAQSRVRNPFSSHMPVLILIWSIAVQ